MLCGKPRTVDAEGTPAGAVFTVAKGENATLGARAVEARPAKRPLICPGNRFGAVSGLA